MRWRCVVGLHEPPLMERSRARLHTLLWRCPECRRVIGSSTYAPSPKLRRTLKVNAKRRALRLVSVR
jgi:hypothetical protein